MEQQKVAGNTGQSDGTAASWYESRLRELDAERERIRGMDRRANTLRFALFFLAASCLFLGYVRQTIAPLQWLGWAGVVAFLVVITWHEAIRDQARRLRLERSVFRRLRNRVQRQWERLSRWEPSEEWLRENEVCADVADDLDLFGQGSLFQLVSMAFTGPGRRTLATWLGAPADVEAAGARAAALDMLAGRRDERGRFYLLARQVAEGAAEPDRFLQWAEGSQYLDSRRWLLWWARLSPVVILATFFVGLALGGAAVGWLSAGAVILVNVMLTVLHLGPIHDIFGVALSGRGDVEGYSQLFAAAELLPADSDSPLWLREIRKQLLEAPDSNAVAALRQLSSASKMASLRHAGLLFLIYVVLQAIALWDVHVLAVLEKWQRRHGNQAGGWFTSLGALEALMSLAALRDENPDWSFPSWLPADPQAALSAVQLGHPLLTNDQRVCNDVTIGPTGTVLLVTGSNMSGKSTLLRAVGLNSMLAAAGAPVCAQQFSLPPVQLATSIRVRDSVREGVSFYMAELKRLRVVVQRARALRGTAGRRVLYLLDEILQGTNNRERQIAVAQVLEHLLQAGAIGAISTHDLDLADDPLLREVAIPVHFREQIQQDPQGQDTMTFDYRMRPGVTPTTNALRLLELVGLGRETLK